MSRAESVTVGVVVGIMCPTSLFILFWWITAALSIYHVIAIPESSIATAAFTGLGIGIVLDVVLLKNWITRFYNADMRLMVLAYLFWSAIAIAFFMGLPFGNIALGTLAGLYIGRKQYHAGGSRDVFTKAARNVSLFAALVTGAVVLPIGLLALHEPIVIEALQAVLRLGQSVLTGPMGVGLVSIVCVVLMAVQFWCTRSAAGLAFRLGENVA